MSKTYKDSPEHKQRRASGHGRQRHISVRGIRRDPPDLAKLSRAVVALAMAQAEADAEGANPDLAETDHAHEESSGAGE